MANNFDLSLVAAILLCGACLYLVLKDTATRADANKDGQNNQMAKIRQSFNTIAIVVLVLFIMTAVYFMSQGGNAITPTINSANVPLYFNSTNGISLAYGSGLSVVGNQLIATGGGSGVTSLNGLMNAVSLKSANSNIIVSVSGQNIILTSNFIGGCTHTSYSDSVFFNNSGCIGGDGYLIYDNHTHTLTAYNQTVDYNETEIGSLMIGNGGINGDGGSNGQLIFPTDDDAYNFSSVTPGGSEQMRISVQSSTWGEGILFEGNNHNPVLNISLDTGGAENVNVGTNLTVNGSVSFGENGGGQLYADGQQGYSGTIPQPCAGSIIVTSGVITGVTGTC